MWGRCIFCCTQIEIFADSSGCNRHFIRTQRDAAGVLHEEVDKLEEDINQMNKK
jgi:hypothetical protein